MPILSVRSKPDGSDADRAEMAATVEAFAQACRSIARETRDCVTSEYGLSMKRAARGKTTFFLNVQIEVECEQSSQDPPPSSVSVFSPEESLERPTVDATALSRDLEQRLSGEERFQAIKNHATASVSSTMRLRCVRGSAAKT